MHTVINLWIKTPNFLNEPAAKRIGKKGELLRKLYFNPILIIQFPSFLNAENRNSQEIDYQLADLQYIR